MASGYDVDAYAETLILQTLRKRGVAEAVKMIHRLDLDCLQGRADPVAETIRRLNAFRDACRWEVAGRVERAERLLQEIVAATGDKERDARRAEATAEWRAIRAEIDEQRRYAWIKMNRSIGLFAGLTPEQQAAVERECGPVGHEPGRYTLWLALYPKARIARLDSDARAYRIVEAPASSAGETATIGRAVA